MTYTLALHFPSLLSGSGSFDTSWLLLETLVLWTLSAAILVTVLRRRA